MSSGEIFGEVRRVTDSGIPLEYYDMKLREWQEERDRLQSGLLMYRYKFEELERRIKLLPAPPEFMDRQIQESSIRAEQACELLQEERAAKEEALLQAQRIIEDARVKSQLYEMSLDELREKLEEEELVKNMLKIELGNMNRELEEEKRRPWWRRLFRKEGRD